MERLRSTLSRLNPNIVGIALCVLALGIFLAPRFAAAPPPPPPAPIDAPAQPAAAFAPAAPPPGDLAMQPAPAASAGPRTLDPLPRPDRPRPPQPPRFGWAGSWLGWIAHQLAISAGLTLAAGMLLVGLLLWRSQALRRERLQDL